MAKKLTTEVVIERSIKTHGDKYRYHNTVYVNTTTKISINCPIHGDFEQRPHDHMNGSECKECAQLSRVATNMKKYGCAHARQNKSVQDKQKLTNLERYGHEYAQQAEEIKEKIKATNLERHGVEYSGQSEQKKQKTKLTWLSNYGVDHPFKSPEIQEKIKNTTFNRYGHFHAAQSEETQNKMKATMMERHGVEYSQQSEEIRAKGRATNLIKYGHYNPFGSEEIQTKIKATNLALYGSEHPWHSDSIMASNLIKHGHYNPFGSEEIQTKIKATNLIKYGIICHSQKHMIDALPLLQSKEWFNDQYSTQGKTLIQIGKELGVGDTTIGRYAKEHQIEIRSIEIGSSCAERIWVESIMESEGIYIQYIGNGKQYKIPGTRWSADGYCEANNTIYEFHGSPWHGNPRKYQPTDRPHYRDKSLTAAELYKKTKEREQKIIDLGYNLVVMWDDGVTYSYHHPT